jgi:hypothetical protein
MLGFLLIKKRLIYLRLLLFSLLDQTELGAWLQVSEGGVIHKLTL